MSIVEIKNLMVDYPGIRALNNISFSIEKGNFLGIIGPNGAGKSTLFACMLGIITNYKGDIKFFGEDIRKSRKYLKKVGYVPQKPVFEKNFPATVKDVVRMALIDNSNPNRVDEILQQVWLHELSHRRIAELSGGQQQLVFIAKSLVNTPEIIILDEPVTGVDVQSTELFYSILKDLNEKQKITIIWSSHDMDAVNKLANKVACLDKTLFFHGSTDEFFENKDLVKQYSEASMQQHLHIHEPK